MNKFFMAAMALGALVACTSDKECDSGEVCDSAATDDSGDSAYTGATTIDSVGYNCDAADWWYDVYSVGWMSSPDLYIYQTGSNTPWDEYHNFPADSYDFDPNGYWDNYYLLLAQTDSTSAVTSGSTTLYDCDDARKATLTWHLVVYDTSGAEADCGVWGDDPASLGTGCPEI